MTAEPAMEAYDLVNLRIKPDYLSRKYQELLGNGYSAQLVRLVMRCVEVEPGRRVGFRQFLEEVYVGGKGA